MPTALDQELSFYEAHKGRLLREAEGKFVLVHGEEILGIFESEEEAISQGYQELGNVPFLVKQIVPVEEPLVFHSSLLDL